MAVAVDLSCTLDGVEDLLRLCQICVLILSSYQTLLWSPTKLNHSHNGTECSSKQKQSDYTHEVLKIYCLCGIPLECKSHKIVVYFLQKRMNV